MEGGFQVVDVRSPSEFADGHMPGALNFPFWTTRPGRRWASPTSRRARRRARLVAMELVSPGLPEYLGELVGLARALPKTGRLAIMCWRGWGAEP